MTLGIACRRNSLTISGSANLSSWSFSVSYFFLLLSSSSSFFMSFSPICTKHTSNFDRSLWRSILPIAPLFREPRRRKLDRWELTVGSSSRIVVRRNCAQRPNKISLARFTSLVTTNWSWSDVVKAYELGHIPSEILGGFKTFFWWYGSLSHNNSHH